MPVTSRITGIMNHHEALTALRNTTSCEVLNSSLPRILRGAASPWTGEERRGQRLPSWERRSAVSQCRRGRCFQSPSFQGRLLTLTPSTCACTHTHTHTQTSLPTGARTGPGGTSPKCRGPSSPRGSCLEVLFHNLEARPVPDGRGDSWTDAGSLHQVTVSGLLPLMQIVTKESLSSPPPRPSPGLGVQTLGVPLWDPEPPLTPLGFQCALEFTAIKEWE